MPGARLTRPVSRLQLRAEAINGLNRLTDLRMYIHRIIRRPTQRRVRLLGLQLQVRVEQAKR